MAPAEDRCIALDVYYKYDGCERMLASKVLIVGEIDMDVIRCEHHVPRE